MKHLLIIAIVCLSLLTTMSSCLLKTYNCKCTTTQKHFTSVSTDNRSIPGGAALGGKKGAQTDCKSYEYDNSSGTRVCELEN